MKDKFTYKKLIEIRNNILGKHVKIKCFKMSDRSKSSIINELDLKTDPLYKNKPDSFMGIPVEIDNTLEFEEFNVEYE